MANLDIDLSDNFLFNQETKMSSYKYRDIGTDNIRLKYSGSDFKFTSQANHIAKLKLLKDSYDQDGKHLQRLYKRRKRVNGQIISTFGQIMEVPSYGYKI